MQNYFRLGKLRIFRAPIYLHWSVLAVSVVLLIIYFQNLILVILAWLSFLSIILIHEVGHAAVAHRLGYRVVALKVCLIHGRCEYAVPSYAPYYEWDEIRIAWGGVSAQALIAMLVFTISALGAEDLTFFQPILAFLGYYNVLAIVHNLSPMQGLDGYKAWRIVPILYQLMRKR